MDFIELNIELEEIQPWRDVLLAHLLNLGFESFVETKTGLQGYIPIQSFKEEYISEIGTMQGVVEVSKAVIKDQNWNESWESNFDPVIIGDLLLIKAPFHQVENEPDFKLVVVIQPQMSFGTGHHQTTRLVSKELFGLDLKGSDILDMGTGTGVLAIIAEKLGANSVYAPDIDHWSYENAKENCKLNECNRIEVVLGDIDLIKRKSFDLIIANINKNVLIEHFSVYSKSLKKGGKLLLSGFFKTDVDALLDHASANGLVFDKIETEDEWALLSLIK